LSSPGNRQPEFIAATAPSAQPIGGRAATTHSRSAQIRRWLTSLAKHLVLILFGFFFALPLLWMLSTALKTDVEVLKYPPRWFPSPFMWSNFPEAFVFVPFATFLKNSVIISVLSVFGALLSCTLPAYGFARLEWRGRDSLFVLVLSTMMLPYQVTMIPLYVVFNKIGWVNTLKPLIVPQFLGSAFFIFMLRQFFSGIPRDLSDSARIDGCSELRILWSIILPLSRPALMVVALFQFLNSWNAFLGPLIYLNDKNLFTVSLGLALMQSGYGLSRFSLIMAATSLFVIPVIVLFFFAQRTFIQGITFTGLKG
jgi:multiple sugar transport system permease protein